jgi:predicted transposase YbfD/YdcC
MARSTRAQKITEENERQAMAFFEGTLDELPDPRRSQGVRYPLRTVVVTALMAMVCGCDDAEAMAMWGKLNEEWLAGIVELPHGTPTQDVYLSVFAALDHEAFSRVFRSWAELLTLRLEAQGKHIAVDGKTSRRSFDKGNEQPATHTVSAWMSEAGLVLGQRKTETKSNEITAIPELLRVLDLRGATITIDAMGCQTKIATTIIEGGGDYLLAVKDNQPTLLDDIATLLTEAADERRRSVDELPRPIFEVFQDTDGGHGRVETRTLTLSRDLAWLTASERWSGLDFVAKMVRERTVLSTGKTSTETSYYIGSGPGLSAAAAATTLRRHWSIENSLHWVLDMAFREDEARHRVHNISQNFTTLRHFALNIIKQDRQRKVGIALSRKRAGWDRSYLIGLMTGTAGS